MAAETFSRNLKMFFVLSFGELVSLIGSSLSGFALGVWVYTKTGSVTEFALISFCTSLPGVLLSPLAGTLVDRMDRRWAMLISDSMAGICTLILAILFFTNRLEVWHIYILTAISSSVGSLQWPAFSSSTTLMVPPEHLGRVNGVIQGGFAIAQIIAPALAGFLVVSIGVPGVLLIDFTTFLISIVVLLIVRIPRPALSAEAKAHQGSVFGEALYGLQYLVSRPALIGLLIFLAVSYFLLGTVGVLVTPLVLSFTTPSVLGILFMIGGSGMLIGSLLMGIWGGPAKRIYGVLGFMFIYSFFIMLAGLQPSVILLGIASFCFYLCQPIVDGCTQTLFQSKVEPGVQGRVFAISGLIAGVAGPLSAVIAGPLADYVFEPLLAVGGPFSGTIVGQIIGVGKGRGIAFLFITFGLLTMLTAVIGYMIPRIRHIDTDLPTIIPNEPAKAESVPLSDAVVS